MKPTVCARLEDSSWYLLQVKEDGRSSRARSGLICRSDGGGGYIMPYYSQVLVLQYKYPWISAWPLQRTLRSFGF